MTKYKLERGVLINTDNFKLETEIMHKDYIIKCLEKKLEEVLEENEELKISLKAIVK